MPKNVHVYMYSNLAPLIRYKQIKQRFSKFVFSPSHFLVLSVVNKCHIIVGVIYSRPNVLLNLHLNNIFRYMSAEHCFL